MEHTRYVTRKRARFDGISGPVNIPFGVSAEVRDGFIFYSGQQLCAVTSQNAYDYFSHDDDGQGQKRGSLVTAIRARIEKRDAGYQQRWDKVWADARSQKYKRPEHEDYWLWNHDFYHAPIEDLQHIANLIGATTK